MLDQTTDAQASTEAPAAQAQPAPQAPPAGAAVPEAPRPQPGGIIDQARARLRRGTIKLEGRVRDDIIGLFKTVPTEWQKMTEREQAKVIDRAGMLGEKLVEDLANMMCSRGFEPIQINIGGGKFDGEKIVCGFALPMSEQNLAAVGGRVGSTWLLIPVDLEDWQGADPLDPDVIGDLRLPRTEAMRAAVPEKGGEGTDETEPGPEAPGDAGEPIYGDPTTGEIIEQPMGQVAEQPAAAH